MINIRYKNIYDEFIKHYKNTHVNPWHNISEKELNKIYNKLISSMDIDNDYNFKYFIDYIIKRLSGTKDAHTTHNLISLIPMNFKLFDDEILINYPNNLKYSSLLSINGINIKQIINEIEEIITYGTKGKRKAEIENALFNRYVLFSLPSLRDSKELLFVIEKINGEKYEVKFNKNKIYSKEELFDYSKYLFKEPGTYKFIDNCLIYNHSSIQNRFKEQIESAIDSLRKEDLSNINTIIIDIRGNMGGNSSLNRLLMDFLEENKDKKLFCLTDYKVFSGGRYALKDLIELGAITIGEEIATPINCYGNSNWLKIDNHYFSVSEKYLHPFINVGATNKEEFKEKITKDIYVPYYFKPDILIEETKKSYINNEDIILGAALEYAKNKGSI